MTLRMQEELSKKRPDVIVIDDEESIREGSRQALEIGGYRASVASDGLMGLRMVEETRPRVVLLDIRMPGLNGMELLKRLPAIDPEIVPIVITGYGTIDLAVSATKMGAFEFITKPFEVDQLLGAVARGLNHQKEIRKAVATAQDIPAHEAPRGEADVVLKGLEALAEYQSLGLKGRTLANELRALEEEAQYHSHKLGQIKEKGRALSDVAADLRLVDATIQKYDFKKNALIQILLDIQSEKRWLPRHVLTWVARRLDLPPSQIHEIVNFYQAFSLVPQGRHMVEVCTGTACHVRHAPQISATVSALLGIQPGQTDAKGDFTLKQVHCLGCCALAPVVKVDGTYHGNPSFKDLKNIFQATREEK